jgi:hypothetical protein
MLIIFRNAKHLIFFVRWCNYVVTRCDTYSIRNLQGAVNDKVSKKTLLNVGEIDNSDARADGAFVHVYVALKVHPFYEFGKEVIEL